MRTNYQLLEMVIQRVLENSIGCSAMSSNTPFDIFVGWVGFDLIGPSVIAVSARVRHSAKVRILIDVIRISLTFRNCDVGTGGFGRRTTQSKQCAALANY
jgi:hypothetical protein